MAPAAMLQTPPCVKASRPTSPPKRVWSAQRPEIPSILVGRGQENASTARHNLEQGMDSEKKSTDNTRIRGRQNSLKRTKDSTDVLRQRSLKRDGKSGVVDPNPMTREGRQFTVANVGNNGKIYLRYDRYQSKPYCPCTDHDCFPDPPRGRLRNHPCHPRLLHSQHLPTVMDVMQISRAQRKENVGQIRKPLEHQQFHGEQLLLTVERSAPTLCLSALSNCLVVTQCQRLVVATIWITHRSKL